MTLTAGIDVGTSAVKAVVMDRRTLLGKHTERVRRRNTADVIRIAFEAAVNRAGLARDDLAYVATTGEGDMCDFRDGHFYGMTTHARGALWLDPAASAAVDIGALHGRAIIMDERGKVTGNRMTSQCASGSGQFLENIARYLGVALEEIGELSLAARKPERCSGICAVLAETDVINMVSRGIGVPDILRGIHESMAVRIVRLLLSAKARGTVVATGGLAADAGLMKAIEDEAVAQKSTITIRAFPESVYAGAIGAAIWGAFRHGVLQQRAETQGVH